MNTQQAVNRYYELVDKFANGYFWGGFGNAQMRKRLSEQNSLTFSGVLHGKNLEISFTISPSCNNLYKKQSITLDGKRVQRRTIEKLLKE